MAGQKKQVSTNIDVGAATAALKAIPDGKIVDFITGRLLGDTPEEYVRQTVAKLDFISRLTPDRSEHGY